MFNRWNKWTYAKPRATTGGIKSRSKRGRIYGTNWWSRRWMEILEESIDTGRLARGRTYAHKGQVVDIEIEPGLVTAVVQGTRSRPYQIRLGFETLSDEAEALLIFRCREQARFAAKLLAGEMPEEMETVFKEAGVPLFPSKSAIRRFKCSCPDDATPCKHITAVLLLLGEVLDDDPFLLLKLRGVNRDTLINLLTLEAGGAESRCDDEEWRGDDDIPDISGGFDMQAAEEPAADVEPLDANWYGSGLPEFTYDLDDKQRRIAALEILNEFPFWRGENPFRQSIAPFYERAAVLAEEILTGEKRKTIGRPKKLL